MADSPINVPSSFIVTLVDPMYTWTPSSLTLTALLKKFSQRLVYSIGKPLICASLSLAIPSVEDK